MAPNETERSSGKSLIPGRGDVWDLRVMTHPTHRTSAVAPHAYSVPVVRELPPRPIASAGAPTW